MIQKMMGGVLLLAAIGALGCEPEPAAQEKAEPDPSALDGQVDPASLSFETPSDTLASLWKAAAARDQQAMAACFTPETADALSVLSRHLPVDPFLDLHQSSAGTAPTIAQVTASAGDRIKTSLTGPLASFHRGDQRHRLDFRKTERGWAIDLPQLVTQAMFVKQGPPKSHSHE